VPAGSGEEAGGMSTASYRLHRPRDFDAFIGQRHIVRALQGALDGAVQHAYLLSGPRGTGKTSLARIYARALQCERRGTGADVPCNECASCLAHLEGRHPDIVELDAATHSGVESVRERVIEPAAYRPILARFRVFILDEVHMLSGAATAALLKLLEEPPAHLVFVLCSTDAHRIPVTLRDRCWQFTLAPGSRAEICELLGRVAPWIDPEAARIIARQAGGSYRGALTMLDTLVSAHGQQWGRAEVVEALRLLDPADAARLYAAIAAADTTQIAEVVASMSERLVDGRALLAQMQEDCHRALLQMYGQQVGDDPVLVVPGRNPAAQIKAWKHLVGCEATMQRDQELAIAMAVYGLVAEG
jgi:DNA polymerase-3 subunit gamma/tau